MQDFLCQMFIFICQIGQWYLSLTLYLQNKIQYYICTFKIDENLYDTSIAPCVGPGYYVQTDSTLVRFTHLTVCLSAIAWSNLNILRLLLILVHVLVSPRQGRGYYKQANNTHLDLRIRPSVSATACLNLTSFDFKPDKIFLINQRFSNQFIFLYCRSSK